MNINYIDLSPNSSFIGFISLDYEALVSMLKRNNQSEDLAYANKLAQLYIEWGSKFNIRPDFAWAQMCYETNFLRFTGIAKKEWNNFCNLGVTGKKDFNGNYLGVRFNDERLGVIGHFAHLAWYLFPEHVNEYCSIEYDPRHLKIKDKDHLNAGYQINCLDNRWAISKSNYSSSLSKYSYMIYDSLAEGRNYDIKINTFQILKNRFIDLANIKKSDKKWQNIAIHHSATLNGNVETFRQFHRSKGWLDIGYNFVICNGDGGKDGELQKGRSLEINGAHVKKVKEEDFNSKTIGICLVGWFDNKIIDYNYNKVVENPSNSVPTKNQMDCLKKLVKDLMIEYEILPANVLGHREFPKVSKSCPGYNFEMNEFRKKMTI